MAVDAGMADRAQRDAGARKLSFLGPAMETIGVHEIHARILSRRIQASVISVFVHIYISFIYGIYNNISLFFSMV